MTNINNYIRSTIEKLLLIPSPSGYTDEIVQYVSHELQDMGLRVEMTRRGALRVPIKGKTSSPSRGIAAHLDTLGAMVRKLKDNGRVEIWPIGHWNARFAEGARVTILSDDFTSYRGTILPLKASGHTYGDGVDKQPSSWENLEVRIDEKVSSKKDLEDLGIHVGDFVAVDSRAEFTTSGYINARHLDNKAGVTCLLALAKSIQENQVDLPMDCHLLFTISEEVGSGASAILHGDVSELVSIDNSTPAPGQNSMEDGVTIGIMDSSGPFDYHLTHHLLNLCKDQKIRHARDVFKYYRTDAASALEAGNDIRTALVCFGADASHGWERTHIDSLHGLYDLLIAYVQSDPMLKTDKKSMQELDEDFFKGSPQLTDID